MEPAHHLPVVRLEHLPPLTEETVGRRIREAYENAGMSRARLSKETRIDYGQIIDWEKGVATPRRDSIQRVAQATGYTYEAIAGPEPDAVSMLAPSPYPGFAAWRETSSLAKRLAAGEVLDAETDASIVATLQRERFLAGEAVATAELFEEMARALVQERRGRRSGGVPIPVAARPRPPGTRSLPRKKGER